jgi:hypothetical protein
VQVPQQPVVMAAAQVRGHGRVRRELAQDAPRTEAKDQVVKCGAAILAE